ncbi:MAG: hypothetical protein LBO05_03620 [Deltaproteobacteria bacterium]|nr:hypothetical protein [Deltaproteobacteria bacterium]
MNPRKTSGQDRDAPELVALDLAAKNIPPGTPEADASRGRDANRVLAMRNGVSLISPVAGGNSRKDEEAGAAGAVVLGVGDFIRPELTGREHLADLEPCPEETAAEAASSRLPSLSDFGPADLGVIPTCPMGRAPERFEANDADDGGACFNLEGRKSRPKRNDRPVKVRVARAGLACTCKQVRVARRRAFEETNEFKRLCRHRSGAEATDSRPARLGMK